MISLHLRGCHWRGGAASLDAHDMPSTPVVIDHSVMSASSLMTPHASHSTSHKTWRERSNAQNQSLKMHEITKDTSQPRQTSNLRPTAFLAKDLEYLGWGRTTFLRIVMLLCRTNHGNSRHDLGNVGKLIAIQSLYVILLHQRIDVFLDIRNLRWEACFDLADDFFDQVDVLELLSRLHDSNNSSL